MAAEPRGGGRAGGRRRTPGGLPGGCRQRGACGAGSAGCNAELGSAETLHFVHSSGLSGHFFPLIFPVGLLDPPPQNAHLGLEISPSCTPRSPRLCQDWFDAKRLRFWIPDGALNLVKT